MLKKLFAVMLAATLMAESAWGGTLLLDAAKPTAATNSTAFGTNGSAVKGDAAGELLDTGVGVTIAAIASTSARPAALGNVKSLNSTTAINLGIGLKNDGKLFTGNTSSSDDISGWANAVDFDLTIGSLQTNKGVYVGGMAKSLAINGNVLIDATTNGILNVTGTKFTQTAGTTKVSGLTTFTGSEVKITGGVATYSTGDTYNNGTQYLGGLNVDSGSYTNTGDVVLGDNSVFGNGTAAAASKTTVEIGGKLYLAGNAKTLTINSGSAVTVGNIGFSQSIATNGNTVTVDGSGAATGDKTTLTIVNKNSTAVVFTGDNNGSPKSQALEIKAGGSVVVEGALQLTGAGDGTSGKTSLIITGTGNNLTADTLTIGDKTNPVQTVVSNAAGLTTTITGLTTVADTAKYTVGGTADQYLGGIVVGDKTTPGTASTAGLTGIASTTANTAIDTGTEFVTLKDGSKIDTNAAGGSVGGTFTINGAGVKIENDGTAANKATIDAGTVTSKIVIENDLNVAGDLVLKTATNAASMITAGTYTQTAGTVTQDTAGQFTVEGAAKIGGEGKDAKFLLRADGTATTNTTTFKEGLTIGEKGVLAADANVTATAKMALGANKTLKLDGGVLDVDTKALEVTGAGTTILVSKTGSEIKTGAASPANSFIANTSKLVVDADYEGAPTLLVSGVAGAAFDDVEVKSGELALTASTVTTNKNVLVRNGAYIANAGGAATLKGTAATSSFTAEAGSNLEAHNGSIALTGFNAATINGNVLIDNTAGVPNAITSDATTTTVGSDAVVLFTTAAANAAKDAIDAGGTYNVVTATGTTLTIAPGALTQNSARGLFAFEYDATTKAMTLVDAQEIVQGTDTDEDRATFYSNALVAWAPKGIGTEIDSSLADASYYSLFPNPTAGGPTLTATVDPDTGIDGNLTLNLLQAMGNMNADYSQGVGKSILRNGNVSETLTAGVGEIRGVTSAIGSRNVQLRGQMASAASAPSGYASLSLNNDYANRIWAGYIGQWEKGDSRNGVAGYDYDSNGFIVGYDRLVGCNFAFGGAFAYSRGDYEDKAAVSNSSKIDNYSVNGYATYSALNGVFASLFGGYTHQKNDIAAVYSTGIAKSSDYDSDYWNIGGQLGYDFQPVDGLVLTPSIGLQYIHGRADSHFSRWSNAGVMSGGYVSGTTQKSLLLPIEVAARYAIDFSNCSRLAIEGNIGYSYNFMDDNGQASMTLANVANGGNEVIIDGYDRDAGRHTFNAGAGLRYTYNRFDIGVKYDYYLQQDAHAHRLMGTVGVSF